MVGVEFELTYYDIAAQHVSHYVSIWDTHTHSHIYIVVLKRRMKSFIREKNIIKLKPIKCCFFILRKMIVADPNKELDRGVSHLGNWLISQNSKWKKCQGHFVFDIGKCRWSANPRIFIYFQWTAYNRLGWGCVHRLLCCSNKSNDYSFSRRLPHPKKLHIRRESNK